MDPEKRSRSQAEWRAKNPHYHSDYQAAHPQQHCDYNRTYRQNQSALLQLWYSDFKATMKCSRCPEAREPCLDFHHIEPELKRFEVKRMIKKGACSLETLIEEVEKCEILCANCHRLHHHEERQKLKNRF